MLQDCAESAPEIVPQPADASTSAAQQDTSEPELHDDLARTQPGDPGTAHAADQGGQCIGSPAAPKRARVQEATHSVDLPATPQTCPPSLAELEGEALQSSPDGEQQLSPNQSSSYFLNSQV